MDYEDLFLDNFHIFGKTDKIPSLGEFSNIQEGNKWIEKNYGEIWAAFELWGSIDTLSEKILDFWISIKLRYCIKSICTTTFINDNLTQIIISYLN